MPRNVEYPQAALTLKSARFPCFGICTHRASLGTVYLNPTQPNPAISYPTLPYPNPVSTKCMCCSWCVLFHHMSYIITLPRVS